MICDKYRGKNTCPQCVKNWIIVHRKYGIAVSMEIILIEVRSLAIEMSIILLEQHCGAKDLWEEMACGCVLQLQ
jgi:hypothetical protein